MRIQFDIVSCFLTFLRIQLQRIAQLALNHSLHHEVVWVRNCTTTLQLPSEPGEISPIQKVGIKKKNFRKSPIMAENVGNCQQICRGLLTSMKD